MGEHFPFRPDEAALKDSESLSEFKNILLKYLPFLRTSQNFVLLFNILQQNEKFTLNLRMFC